MIVFCRCLRGVLLWRSPRQVRSQGARVRPPGSGARARPGRRGAGGGPGPGGRGCLARRGPVQSQVRVAHWHVAVATVPVCMCTAHT